MTETKIKVFGITGGIACGKSTVTKLILRENIPIIDADQVARDVVVPGSVGLQLIVDTFGKEFLLEDGSLNRKLLGSLVFSDKSKLDLINQIMFPLIDDHVNFSINLHRQCGYKLIGYDAALIIEMGNADKYRPLIVVHCDVDTQIARIVKRNQVSEVEAKQRIDAQIPAKEKIKYADFVIDTSGTIEESEKQTLKIIETLKGLIKS